MYTGVLSKRAPRTSVTDQQIYPQLSTSANNACEALVFNSQRIRGICILAVVAIHATPEFPTRTPVDWATVLLIYAKQPCSIRGTCLRPDLRLLPEPKQTQPAARSVLSSHPEVPRDSLRGLHDAVLGGSLCGGRLSRCMEQVPHRRAIRQILLWNLRHASAEGILWFIPAILGLYLLHPFLRSAYELVGHNGRFVALAFIFQLAFGTLDEAYRQSIRQSEFRWLADLGLSFLPLLGVLRSRISLYTPLTRADCSARGVAAKGSGTGSRYMVSDGDLPGTLLVLPIARREVFPNASRSTRDRGALWPRR